MQVRLLSSCKLRLRRASPTVGLYSGPRALLDLRRLYAAEANPAATMPHTLPGRNAPGPRLACPTGSQASRASRNLLPLPHKAAGVVKWGWWRSELADGPWAPVAQGHLGAEIL